MKKILLLAGLAGLAAAPLLAQQPATYRNPVFHGDLPDPSIIRVGGDFYATATSSEWGPEFPILHSKDLVNWDLVGAVFPVKPAWAEANFWAPEIEQWKGRFYVYYVAKKRGGPLAVAVATAERPEGPWTDHGPLVAQDAGSIDAMAVDDEKGQRWMIWKEDGNSKQRPCIIWAQRLDDNGVKLVGETHELMRNDAPWEGPVVEAPFVLRRGEWFYLFYAGNACCGRGCQYAEGVARSKTLLGPWEKCPRNPILSTNEAFRGPGHGSVVTTADGRCWFLCHAYDAKSFIFVGRQMVLNEITFDTDGWPVINDGKGCAVSAPAPLGVPQRGTDGGLAFSDNFADARLRPGWLWPQDNPPQVRLNPGLRGRLSLQPVPARAREPLGAVLARSSPCADYAATTAVDLSQLKAGMTAGISAYGDAGNALGLVLGNGQATVWQMQRGQRKELGQLALPKAPLVHLRLTATDGHRFQFAVSADGKDWKPVGDSVDGDYLPPWDRGIRVALTAGGAPGAEARFDYFRLEPAGGQTPP